MNEKISVIVPVYNVENYLAQCMDSILNQTYKNLDIILIDDGSTDNSGNLCDRYGQLDDRVRVIHQENRGAANAKNVGLSVAEGEFLAFVDSDDFLEPDAYEYMVDQLQRNRAEVIQCGFRNIYINAWEDCLTLSGVCEFTAQEFLKRFTADWTCGLLWDKLYRRKLFAGVYFEEGHKIDDEFFTYQGILNAEKILYVPKIIYNYRKRKSSIMLSPESQQKIIIDKLEYLDKRRKKVTESFPDLKQDFDYHFLSMLLILSKEKAATVESIQMTKELLKRYFKEEKQHCKIDKSLRFQLLQIEYLSSKKILSKRKIDEKYVSVHQCFE